MLTYIANGILPHLGFSGKEELTELTPNIWLIMMIYGQQIYDINLMQAHDRQICTV